MVSKSSLEAGPNDTAFEVKTNRQGGEPRANAISSDFLSYELRCEKRSPKLAKLSGVGYILAYILAITFHLALCSMVQFLFLVRFLSVHHNLIRGLGQIRRWCGSGEGEKKSGR